MAPVGDTLLQPDLREAFLSRARNLKVRKSQIVIAEGTDSTDVYLVRSGKLRISLSAANGREILLRDIGPGAVVGELPTYRGEGKVFL